MEPVMRALAEVQEAVAKVVTTVGPAVVGIGGGWAKGCGVVVGDGLVLTNAHNLRGGEVPVSFGDDRVVVGQLAGVDLDGDLAVIAVETEGIAPIGWPEGDHGASVGTVVLAVANPGG